MHIRGIEAIPFLIPYEKPFAMASGTVTAANHVLIRVLTNEDLLGIAEAAPRSMIYGESQASIVAAVEEMFEPAIVGLDVFATERIDAALSGIAGNNTVRGAIDIALHDLRGKALGCSTWKLLGAASDRLRVTHMLGLGTPNAVAEEAARMHATYGIDCFKVKVGSDVRAAATTVATVREAVGTSAQLYVDANQALTAEAAIRLVEAVGEDRLAFLEEPCPASDVHGRRALASRISVPIMDDESARTADEAAARFLTGTTRAVSVKTARTGFTESARVVALARGLHVRAVMGSQGDSSIGSAAALCFGAALSHTAREAAELSYFLSLGDELVEERLTIEDGWMYVDPSVCGVGVKIDAEKLARYRQDR